MPAPPPGSLNNEPVMPALYVCKDCWVMFWAVPMKPLITAWLLGVPVPSTAE